MSRSNLKAGIILLVSLLVGMWWLSTFQYSMKWDIMDITLPWSHFISESLRSGNLPLWNPYLKNGFPMMGLPDTWYPISWAISLLVGMDVWSIQFEYLLHLFIGGFGMYNYALLKKIDLRYGLALGVCYMFSGFMVGNAQHLGWVVGAAWLPWVLYYFDKLMANLGKLDMLKLSLVGGLLFYGAYPPITIISAYILFTKLVLSLLTDPQTRSTKVFWRLATCLIICVSISAVGLVGLYDLSPNLNRGGQLPLSNTGWGVLTGFFPLQAISSIVIPYGDTAVDSFWGSDISLINAYFGFGALLTMLTGLMLRSKQTWMYFAIGAFCLMIAMSEVFPFRAWLYHLPMFDMFRFPSLFRFFAIFYFLLASGFAYSEIKRSDRGCLLYTSPSPRDATLSRMPSSA